MLAVLLCAALPAAAQEALYWWETGDGGIEVGPTPPPGVRAVPWDPGAPAPEPSPEDGASAPTAAEPPPAAAAHAGEDCAPHRALAHELAQATRRIEALEAQIVRLEETAVAKSFQRCRRHPVRGFDASCDAKTFDRDAELERARQSLAEEQEALADLEARARHDGIPLECLRDPNE